MIAKKSPFVLKDFFLLKQNFEFISPTEVMPDFTEVFNSYNIDIDFDIKKEDKADYHVFVKLQINNATEKQPGYAIYAEGVGIFTFETSFEPKENEISNFLYFSGISICINSLRSVIASVTSHGVIGKYNVPAIDVNELLKEKGVLKKTQKNK